MAMSLVLRRLVILGTPLTLAVLEFFHPRNSGHNSAFDSLLPRADWWLALHVLQLPLFGLIGLAVYLLVAGLHGLAAMTCRIAIWFFLVFYIAYDSVNGIATGVLLRTARGMPVDQQDVVRQLIEGVLSSPLVGNLSVVFALGALGWVVAVVAAAIALERAHAPGVTVVFLVLTFFGPHNFPIGTLAMGFFFVGAAWLEFTPQKIVPSAAASSQVS